MNTRQLGFFILTLLAGVVIASCGRKSASPVYSSASLSEAEVRRDLVEDFPDWDEVYLPVKLKVSGSTGISLSGRATMIHGERIHISFRMLGMEVASVYADKDSVFIADKYHKMLFAEDLAALSSRYGVTLANLQDVLLGRPAILGLDRLTESDVKQFLISPVSDGYALSSLLKSSRTRYSYEVSRVGDSDISVRLFSVLPPGSAPLRCVYSEPESTPAGWLPSSASFSCKIGEETELTVSLQWGFGDARWNSPRQINWRRPSGYREVNAASLFKLIGRDS